MSALELAVYLLGAFAGGVLCCAGGWLLRGLRDRYRAEVERDREWDRQS